jgi:hypothetical protein
MDVSILKIMQILSKNLRKMVPYTKIGRSLAFSFSRQILMLITSVCQAIMCHKTSIFLCLKTEGNNEVCIRGKVLSKVRIVLE